MNDGWSEKFRISNPTREELLITKAMIEQELQGLLERAQFLQMVHQKVLDDLNNVVYTH